jgi:hypothetical protein
VMNLDRFDLLTWSIQILPPRRLKNTLPTH